MALEISPEAIRFVSKFNPEQLRDMRLYLNSTNCQPELRELLVEDGSLSLTGLMVLDAIIKQNQNIRFQILARIDQVLAGMRAA
ncbi:hypothetical protein ACFL3T_03620 [Patescibacteria group bacterium]